MIFSGLPTALIFAFDFLFPLIAAVGHFYCQQFSSQDLLFCSPGPPLHLPGFYTLLRLLLRHRSGLL